MANTETRNSTRKELSVKLFEAESQVKQQGELIEQLLKEVNKSQVRVNTLVDCMVAYGLGNPQS